VTQQLPDIFSLAGRVALVTGAGSGLGKAYAHALAAAGARVLCVDKEELAAQACAESIKALGQAADAATMDVSLADSVTHGIEELAARHGPVGILVNNAGITSLPARTHEVSIEDWDRVMAVNLRGMFFCSRAVLPDMMRSGKGVIINIASIVGMVGVYPGFTVSATPYASSKAAVAGFTRQLAAEYASDGIRVNAIAPGWHGGTALGRARRELATADDLQQFESYISSSVPMRRRGTPDEMDGLVVYLASDASRYLTGQVIAHDGGVTAT
jgi:NAD(P)-dependent dehydrogenase (short-subunit alcohol dehydrogenase family)